MKGGQKGCLLKEQNNKIECCDPKLNIIPSYPSAYHKNTITLYDPMDSSNGDIYREYIYTSKTNDYRYPQFLNTINFYKMESTQKSQQYKKTKIPIYPELMNDYRGIFAKEEDHIIYKLNKRYSNFKQHDYTTYHPYLGQLNDGDNIKCIKTKLDPKESDYKYYYVKK